MWLHTTCNKLIDEQKQTIDELLQTQDEQSRCIDKLLRECKKLNRTIDGYEQQQMIDDELQIVKLNN